MLTANAFAAGWGSSPHARGAHRGRPLDAAVRGLIPARAGSTSTAGPTRVRTGAHPRTRGEHVRLGGGMAVIGGSSPHARGAHGADTGQVSPVGLIPARAGSTSAPHGTTRPLWAHPRTRGEHELSSTPAMSRMGSSPHARGARGARLQRRPARGLIPARAGSTSRPGCAPGSRRAHPRTRGEHFRPGRGRCSRRGSSPHARGAPRVAACFGAPLGLIPARAGSTSTPRTC